MKSYPALDLQDNSPPSHLYKHHYHSLPKDLKETIGILPDGYLAYFTIRFPDLFISVYNFVMDSDLLRNVVELCHYFEPSY